ERLVRGRHRAGAHDRRVDTSHRHGADHGHRLDAQILGALCRHHDHAGGTIGDLRGRTSRYGTAFWVERRLEGRQALQGGIRTNGFIVVEDLEETVLVVTLHRDDFILEQAFDGRLVRQTVRTLTEGILLLAADAMHLAQHFSGQTHHARRLGGVQRQLRVRIHAVHHADVAHVLDTTDDKDVAVTGHDRLSGSVQRAHGRTAQAADSLRRAGVGNAGHQGSHTGNVPALLQGLVDAAPDHIFHFCRIDLRVACKHALDQLRRHGLSAGVAVHAALGTTHRGTAEVDNDDVSRIKAHILYSLD